MDVLITTNSPGEVSAWVRPMVRVIKEEWPEARITVFIPPCTFASGREVPVVQSFPEVDQVVGPREFIRYAVLHYKPRFFRPAKEGFVIFLGGDLAYAVLLGKRLKYPVYAYSERTAGHISQIRRFFVPSKRVAERLQQKSVPLDKLAVVGDLMLDAVQPTLSPGEMAALFEKEDGDRLVNVLPGSRPHEVAQTLPFFLQALLLLTRAIPGIVPVVTLAPFITMEQVERYLRSFKYFDWKIEPTLKSECFRLHLNGEVIFLYRGISYNSMQVTDLALALPGTNNVELAALEVPVLVVLPLNWPDLIPLPGVVGMVGQIPVLGSILKKRVVIPKLLPKFPTVSLLNRVAGTMIYPEMIGVLTPEEVGERARTVLEHELVEIQHKLKSYATERQAAARIIAAIQSDLKGGQS